MKQLLVFLLLLCSASISAQDVIVKKDGSTIVCRVVELTDSEITYKKWSDLNGSNYVMNRADASAINYESGKKVNLSEATNLYTPNNQNDGVQQYNDRALMNIDYASNRDDKKYKTIGWIGGGVLLATGVTILVAFNDKLDDYTYETNTFGIIGGISCIAAGIGWTTFFLIKSNKVKNEYMRLQSSTIYQYNFNLSNGTSLSLGADLLRDNTLGQNTLGLGLRYNF